MPRSLTKSDAGQGEDPDLALIVGTARSGTTLLRLLLGAQPTITSPAEAGIPALMEHLARVWAVVDGWGPPSGSLKDDTAGKDCPSEHGPPDASHIDLPRDPRGRELDTTDLPAHVLTAVREAVSAPMRHSCARDNKSLYCDKSLDSVFHLDIALRVFPQLRCIMIFRHVMDVVASGLETSPWGFQAYGYLPFVQASPTNFVLALVNCWLNHVDAALRWEAEHPEHCHRVRYEDLVSGPVGSLSAITRFLDVPFDASAVDRALAGERGVDGPGDYKVAFTTSVHANSIGHGKRVPVGLIPEDVLSVVNEKLSALGYDPIGPSWNTEPCTDRRRASLASRERLTRLLENVRVSRAAPGASASSFAVVADDDVSLRWVVDPDTATVRRGDGDVDVVLTGAAEDLALMIEGEENLGVLMRTGRIRHVTAMPEITATELVEMMTSISRTLRKSESCGARRLLVS